MWKGDLSCADDVLWVYWVNWKSTKILEKGLKVKICRVFNHFLKISKSKNRKKFQNFIWLCPLWTPMKSSIPLLNPSSISCGGIIKKKQPKISSQKFFKGTQTQKNPLLNIDIDTARRHKLTFMERLTKKREHWFSPCKMIILIRTFN